MLIFTEFIGLSVVCLHDYSGQQQKSQNLLITHKAPEMRKVFLCQDVFMLYKTIIHDDVIKMETYSALLAICAGNSTVTGEFPAQRPVTWSFDVFFDLGLIERLSKQSRGWWFETASGSLWRHCNRFYCGFLKEITAFKNSVSEIATHQKCIYNLHRYFPKSVFTFHSPALW